MVVIENLVGTLKDNESFSVKCDYMEIQENGISILIGPNGSGKSTFAKAIDDGRLKSGIVRHKEGESIDASKIVYFNGEDLRILAPHHSLYEHLTISNRKLFSSYSFPKSNSSYEILTRKYDKYLSVNMKERIDSPINDFSSGQKQLLLMLMMARRDIELLIADEPTAHLDANWSWRIFSELQEMAKAQKVPVLFVTHDLTIVEKYGQLKNTYLCDNGMIVNVQGADKYELTPDALVLLERVLH